MLLLTALSAQAQEYDQIIVNSEDWQDVYSAMLYGSFLGQPVKFLVSTRHASILLFEIPQGTSLRVLSSRDLPYAVGYESFLQVRGYPTAEESYARGELNLELASELDVRKFIVVDPSYGYNAVSVAPYAVRTQSFVLFASDRNINEIVAFLNDRDPESVLIYGSVDREVRDGLRQFNPDAINSQGDRYLNNLEIARRFLDLEPTKQVIFSNGEFIEQEIMSGSEAIIFIGTGNVPEAVKDFLQEHDIQVGVLIGNQYVGSATTIRRQTGTSVFVKFARGARNPQGPIAQVEGLDLFYLPSYQPRLSIFSITYNQVTRQLEVTIKNEEDLATYFRGTYTVLSADGQRQRIGDVEPVFLDGGKYKTIAYDVGQLSGDIAADALVLFGESPGSLDYLLDLRGIAVQSTTILDNSQLDIEDMHYDAVRNRFVITLVNLGDVPVYADIEVFDLVIAGDRQTIGAESVVRIPAGGKARVLVPAVLEAEDYADNPKVNIRVFYGQREEYLVKTLVARMDLAVRTVDYVTIGLVVLVILIILLLLLFFLRRRRKRHGSRWSGSLRR